MIRRRACLVLVCVLGAALTAHSQPARRLPVIGILSLAGEGTAPLRILEGELRVLGYEDRATVRLERRVAFGDRNRLTRLAAELVSLPADVIVAVDPPATLAARQATTAIPIVMRASVDPVASGLVASLGHPGGNITGVYSLNAELSPKRLELLKEAIPALTRVAMLWDATNRGARKEREKTERAARTLHVQLSLLAVRRADQLDAAFQRAVADGAQGVIALRSPMIVREHQRLVDLAARNRLAAIYDDRRYVEAGGLMSYGANLPDLYRRAAGYVDKILKGAKPGDLPVEQPETLELAVNLKTAKALGLTVPDSILLRADEVIR